MKRNGALSFGFPSRLSLRRSAERTWDNYGDELFRERCDVLVVHSRDMPGHTPAEKYARHRNVWNWQ